MSSLTVIPSVVGIMTTLNSLREAGTGGTIASYGGDGDREPQAGQRHTGWRYRGGDGCHGLIRCSLRRKPDHACRVGNVRVSSHVDEAYEHCKPFR